MRRFLYWAALFALALFVVQLVRFHEHWWFWFEVHSGTHYAMCGSSACPEQPYYNFFSGFGSDIGELTLITMALAWLRHKNCHHRGCWRLSSHVTKDGYALCKTHVGKSKDELDLHDIHDDHL